MWCCWASCCTRCWASWPTCARAGWNKACCHGTLPTGRPDTHPPKARRARLAAPMLVWERKMFVNLSEFEFLQFLEPGRAEPAREPAAVAPARPAVRVTLRDLHKYYGERHVLKGLDLDIAPGEFVAVVGRSGCGKSTLLRLLAGLEAPSAARGQPQVQAAVRFDTVAQAGADERVRIMFQDARLLPWKRVIDNVAIGMPARERGRAAGGRAGGPCARRPWRGPALMNAGASCSRTHGCCHGSG